jgi:hypothetical protein
MFKIGKRLRVKLPRSLYLWGLAALSAVSLLAGNVSARYVSSASTDPFSAEDQSGSQGVSVGAWIADAEPKDGTKKEFELTVGDDSDDDIYSFYVTNVKNGEKCSVDMLYEIKVEAPTTLAGLGLTLSMDSIEGAVTQTLNKTLDETGACTFTDAYFKFNAGDGATHNFTLKLSSGGINNSVGKTKVNIRVYAYQDVQGVDNND